MPHESLSSELGTLQPVEFILGISPQDFLSRQEEFRADLAAVLGVSVDEIQVLSVKDASVDEEE